MSQYSPDLFADPDQAVPAGYAGRTSSSTMPLPRGNRDEKGCQGAPGTLARLKERVARIERGRLPAAGLAPPLATGVAGIDRTLAETGEAGLAAGAMHGIAGPGAQTLLLGLLKRLMARDPRPVLWGLPWTAPAALYGPGLAQAGLATERLILARARKPAELLWALEEGLRSGALAAAVGEPDGRLTLTASRRLQLAAETGGGFGFLISTRDDAAAPSALHSRWRAEPLPSEIGGDGAVTRRLDIALLRHRSGATGHWEAAV